MREYSEVQLSDRVLSAWQSAVLQFVPPRLKKKTVGHTGDSQIHFLIQQHDQQITELWEAYTSDRGNLGHYQATSIAGAYAYLLGFHLPNAARLDLLLNRARIDQRMDLKLLSQLSCKVIDLGVGTGAMTSAMIGQLVGRFGFDPQRISAEILDRSGAFLDVAKVVLSHQLPLTNVRGFKMPLEQFDISRSAEALDDAGLRIVLLGYVWNEISNNRGATESFMRAMQACAKAKFPMMLVFADSSNELQARDAMMFRNVISSFGLKPVYPCPSAAPCPMIEERRDWCYSEGLWKQPASMQRLDKMLNVNRSRMATSGYVFLNAKAVEVAMGADSKVGVVVGRPTSGDRDFYEYLICKDGKISRAMGDEKQTLRGSHR